METQQEEIFISLMENMAYIRTEKLISFNDAQWTACANS